jgi:hypothetical protein
MARTRRKLQNVAEVSSGVLWAKPTVEQNLVLEIGTREQVSVNEDVVLKEVGKTYHVCPTYNGGRDRQAAPTIRNRTPCSCR